jgi:hypothetical protein
VVAEVLPDNAALLARADALADRMLAIPELTRRHMRTMFAMDLKRKLLEQVGYGLAVEGISATDLRTQAAEKAVATGKKPPSP